MPSKYNKRATKANYGRSNDFTYDTKSKPVEDRDFVWYDYPFTIITAVFLIVIHGFFIIYALIFSLQTNILLTIPPQFVELFAQNNAFMLAYGFPTYYRFVTSIFIHENIIHLGGNLLFFLMFSLRLEELKGWKVTAAVFMFSGLFGNFLTFVLLWNVPMTSLGASGAVMGVFIANLIALRKTYNRGSVTMLAFLVIFGSLFIGGSASTNFIAHFGGLIGGAISMLAIEKYEKRFKKRYPKVRG